MILTGLVAQYGVNVPHWDQWDTPALALIQMGQGTLDFGDLFAQHNESRMVFPRLLWLALASLGGWHVKREMFFTLGLAGLVSLGLWRLSRQTLPLGPKGALALWAMSNWLLFSLSQWDNWFWGLQFATVVPIACIVAGLLLLNTSQSPLVKVLGSGVLATISTFSFANGLLVWVVLLPTVAVVAWVERPRHRWLPLAWLGWMASATLIYFAGYQKPQGHPGLGEALGQPVKAVAFFLVYLGAPFGFGDRYAAAIFGLILLILFALFCTFLGHRLVVKRDVVRFRQGLPWAAIGSYAVLSALLTTAGRVGFGVDVALAPKYTTFSTVLAIALLHGLSWMIIASPRTLSLRQPLRFGALALAGMFLVGYGLTLAHGWRGLVKNYETRTYAKVCLMLINVVEVTDCVEAHNALYPLRTVVEERSNLLQAQGLLRPLLLDDDILKKFQISQPGSAHGVLDLFAPDGQGNFTAQGWAILPEQRRPAPAVVLTYTTASGITQPLQVIKVADLRPDVAAAVGQPYGRSGWQGTVLAQALPADAITLQAWAFDVDTQTAYSLGSGHPIPALQ
ncbi:MAG: hypothetical protein ACFCVD_13440 [Nodosilinea sp.]